jgi:hypothetical protein
MKSEILEALNDLDRQVDKLVATTSRALITARILAVIAIVAAGAVAVEFILLATS